MCEHRRIAAVGRVGIAAVALLACSSAPDGFLDVEWGDDLDSVEGQLGTTCSDWQPWLEGGFAMCDAGPHTALGRQARLYLVRQGGALVGLQLHFDACAGERERLLADVSEALETEPGADYVSWDSGEVVRLEDQGDDCLLTVAGRELGEAYQRSGGAPWLDL